MPNRRMRKRRNKNRRSKSGGFGVAYGVAAAAVTVALIAVAVSVFFKIGKIEVTGLSKYTSVEICEAADIKTGDSMYFLNKFDAINKMFDKLPYVEEVRITRRLPDTLVVEVTEAKPVVTVGSETGVWFVSAKGRLLECAENDTSQGAKPVEGLTLALPAVGDYLVTNPPEQGEPLLEILKVLNENGMADKVDGMDFSKLYDIRVKYGGRFIIKLGLPENIGKKLLYFKEIEKKLDTDATGTVDITGEKIIFTPGPIE